MAGNLQKKPTPRRDRADAARLQKAGTHGDTVLAHVNPAEAGLLDLLADGRLDGGGRNPTTGLLSFGMSDGESGGFGGSSGNDSNPGGVGGGPAGGQTGGGIGGNTADGMGGLGGGYGDSYGIDNPYAYAPEDTFARVVQEYFTPSPYASMAPGRFGAPTARGPGIMGTVAGKLAGGPMSAMMGVGEAMGRASSPATQALSAAEMSARGSMNSTGQDRDAVTGLSLAELEKNSPGTQYAGTQSGAATAQVPPGYSVNPAGQLIPLPQGGNNRPAYQDPLRNMLLDYVLRGRQGGGLLGW